MRAPARHDGAVFAALLGGPGTYRICPRDPWDVWGGYDEDGTLVRVGRWTVNGLTGTRGGMVAATSLPGHAETDRPAGAPTPPCSSPDHTPRRSAQ